MEIWEYLVVTYYTSMRDADITAFLNKHGQQGWNLASEVHYGNGSGTRYTFKRLQKV